MLFNSIIFIGAFLPIALLGWYGLQQLKNLLFAKIFLVGMSLWFYGYYNWWYLIILVCSVIANYAFSKLFEMPMSKACRKLILLAGILSNIGLLFYFKYFNFFLDNCNFLFHTSWHVEKIALPLESAFLHSSRFLL